MDDDTVVQCAVTLIFLTGQMGRHRAILCGLANGKSIGTANHNGRNVDSIIPTHDNWTRIFIVVGDHANGTGRFNFLGLFGKQTTSTLNQCDLAR